MRRLVFVLFLFLFLLLPEIAEAANRYVAATGSWTSTGTWSSASCTGATGAAVPTSADDVILCPGKTVTVPCNTSAALRAMSDDDSWVSGDTGGLVADGSACSAGQVPTFSFSSVTAAAQTVYLDVMPETSTYQLVGRSITADAPWGEPSDLTDSCGGADKTVNGVTWETAKNECSKYTWANKPYSASIPAGMSGLSLGNLVWWTSGMYRHNFATVISSTSNTLTIGYGDPDDAYGTQSSMPAINGSGSTSVELPMDVSLTAWNTANPTRIYATIQTGALSALPGAASGTGQRNGWCLVTNPTVGTPGSGKFYQIAGTVDGGGSNDTLILQPWTTIADADLVAGFLAIANNAWISPCVRPGDRWYSFEPVVMKPATAGTNYLNFVFAYLCPQFTRVSMPNIASGDESPIGTEPWADETAPAIGFYGQRNCTIGGPWAIGPVREIALNGYAGSIKGVHGFTISNTSMQGNYWITSPADTVTHAWAFFDSEGLVFDRVNVSFVNNDVFYMHQGTEEVSQSDEAFEGLDLTIKNSNVHDVFHKVGLTDTLDAISLDANLSTTGTYTFKIYDNIIWNVVRTAIDFQANTQPYTALVYSNVIGPQHRQGEVDTFTARGIKCFGPSGGTYSGIYVANNVLNSTLDYNMSTGGTTYAMDACNTTYNYIGEWATALNHSTGPTTQIYHYGDLIYGGGAVSNASILTTSTSQYGFASNRANAVTGTEIVRDLTFIRFCSLMGVRFAAFQLLGQDTPPSTQLDIHYTHNTFGMYCPEASAATVTSNSAAIFHQNRQSLENLVPGSEISDNLFITGDTVASSTFKVFPIYLYDGLTDVQDGLPAGTKSFTLGKNMCSVCDNAAGVCGALVTGQECCRNCSNGAGSPYTFNQTGQNMERLTPARTMESLGIASVDDPHLLRGGAPFAFTDGANHVGARYSGIISYSQAMTDFDIPPAWLYYRATDSDVPDASVVPPTLRFLLKSNLANGWIPRKF